MGEPVKLESLDLEQLQKLKQRMDEEIKALRTNLSALGTAVERYSVSLETLQSVSSGEKELMIPMSSSMYAKGRTDAKDRVMIDLGTGFFAKVSNQEGQAIIQRKIDYVKKNRAAFQEQLVKKAELIERVVNVYQRKVREQTLQNQPPKVQTNTV